MLITQTFDDAEAIETDVYSFDFRRDVASADEVVSAVFTLSLVSGVDANPAGHLVGIAAISANLVDGRDTVASQRISGLVAGCVYRVSCQATSNQGNTPNLYSHVTCRAQV